MNMIIALLLGLAPIGTAQVADPIFTVYMAPTGVDTNDGLTTTTPVKTLDQVQKILVAAQPASDVEVRIKQGVYVAPQEKWTFYVPGHTVSFLPIDYQYGEGISGIAGRPIFRGNGAASYWLLLRLPTGDPGGDTGLRFYYLQVERYSYGAINVNGGYLTNAQGLRVPSTAGMNSNEFVGLKVTHIGSKHNAGGYGYGAIILSNSSNNSVRKNHLYYLENTSPHVSLIHGVYVEHGSSGNSIRENYFFWNSGDAAHTRNEANNNLFDANIFERTSSTTAYYGEWFCDGTCVNQPTNPRECASHGNLFTNNNVISGYNGGTMPLTHLAPPGNSYAGGSGCNNAGQLRVTTSGNS